MLTAKPNTQTRAWPNGYSREAERKKSAKVLSNRGTFETHFLVDPLDAPAELCHRRVVHEEILDGSARLVLEPLLGIASGNRWLLLVTFLIIVAVDPRLRVFRNRRQPLRATVAR